MSENEIICYCSNITKGEIIKAIQNGAKDLKDIQKMTKACTAGNCKELSPKKRCCSVDIIKILDEYKK